MNSKDYYIAIDLGSSNVVAIVGEITKDNQLRIVDFAMIPIPNMGMSAGEIKNIELVGKSLTEALNQIENHLGIKVLEAYTGISGSHVQCAKHSYLVYVGNDGEITKEQVKLLDDGISNVQAPEGQNILKILPQNYIIDSTDRVSNPIGMFGKKLEANFNFIISNRLANERLEKAIKKVGVEQKAMYINTLVSANAVVLDEEKEAGVAVVDLGAGTADLTIYHDNSIVHLAVIPVGMNLINKDIRECGILEKDIENLKVKLGNAVLSEENQDSIVKIAGRTPKEIPLANLTSIIEARVKDIIDFVMSEIKLSGFEKQLGAGIVLTGGGAKLQNIDKLFSNCTKYDVRIGSAEDKVSEDSKDIAENTSLSTAIGILLEAISSKAPAYNCEVSKKITEPIEEPEPKEDTPKKDSYENPKLENFESEIITEKKDEEKEAKKTGVFKRLFGKISEAFDYIDDTEGDK